MVNSLLFRWEDSPALQHHCGFCERPLSHPGARASCFGTHSEPCHRFHQAMFMRDRAHMCNYCRTIDEAHYKRHHELVGQLRSIYESCGEVDWTIVPAEPGDPRRGRLDPQSANCTSSDRDSTPETSISKRERKDAKSLARAASRARVVTQEEIRYVDSVLHSVEGLSGSDAAAPANVEEMQLSEEHLRYNANVYNSHSSCQDLRQFAKIPDVDVDFEAEMGRVLDTFRITELVKRNLKNCGLQGKELKHFESLVEVFKDTIVEDLVLVKKDMMEIRMRRAGYLRYTSKTAYDIVEERYSNKDWKTGDRITSFSSDSSDHTSLSEELITPYRYGFDPHDFCSDDTDLSPSANSNMFTLSVLPSTKGPDRRHLEDIHTRVSGDDGLGQKVIEPYHAPLLPLTPNITPRRPAILQLKVIENKENKIPAGMTNRGWLRRDVARQTPSNQAPQKPEKEKLSPASLSVRPVAADKPISVTKPGWGKATDFTSPSNQQGHVANEKDFPALDMTLRVPKSALPRFSAPAVQASLEHETTGLRGPERAENAHPVVSQKKAKKAQREAKRKAKKGNNFEETSSPTAVKPSGLEDPAPIPSEASLNASNNASDTVDKVTIQLEMSMVGAPTDSGEVTTEADIVTVEEQTLTSHPPTVPFPQLLQCTTHGKHDHWTRFSRYFLVDQLTVPLLQTFDGCSHGSSCLFESHGTIDCPFHEPHCPCSDPLQNQCYLMHPGKELYTSGPYNRAHGERLMAVYQQHELTKDRVMLVDDDLVSHFVDTAETPQVPDRNNMPPRLLREHTDFSKGYERGPLMKQELQFDRLVMRNMVMRNPPTMRMLQDIQRQDTGRKGSVTLCYCYSEVQGVSEFQKEFSKGFVTCCYRDCEFGGVFHAGCVKNLGHKKVSRWYCTACEQQMKILALEALCMSSKDHDAIMGRAKTLAELVDKSGAAINHFKSRMQELYTANNTRTQKFQLGSTRRSATADNIIQSS